MALPKVDTPKYRATIPSSGKEVEFRPFLVAEEKVLMIAAESRNATDILNAICNVVDACTFGKVKSGDLASYDVEYLFLKLRSKSVSEISEFSIKCDHVADDKKCTGVIPITVNLDEVKVDGKSANNKIHLTESMVVKLKHPTVTDMINYSSIKDPVELMYSTIYAGVVAIADGDTVYTKADFTLEEFKEWLDALRKPQFMEIKDFFASSPTLKYRAVSSCPVCKTKYDRELKGLLDFFQ